MNSKISVIGLPMDLGQNRRGVDMGPNAMRYAGAIKRLTDLGYVVSDLGDIPRKRFNQGVEDENKSHLKNLYQVTKANEQLAVVVDQEVAKGTFPLIFGGDHSIAIGSIAGIAKHYEKPRGYLV